MECKCGGATRSAKAERRKINAILHYQECGACGRCSVDALYIEDKLVASGVEAQRRFQAIEAELEAGAGKPTETPLPKSDQQELAREPEVAPTDSAAAEEPSQHEPEHELVWQPPSIQPAQQQMVMVEFVSGGSYVAHASYFAQSWDLVSRWAACTSRTGLRRSSESNQIPAELRVNTPKAVIPPDTPDQSGLAAPTIAVVRPKLAEPQQGHGEVQPTPTPTPAPAPAPAPILNVPVGANLAFDF